MRMSDWSSDVCSSDLRRQCRAGVPAAPRRSDDPPVRARESRLAARRKSAHGGGHDARGNTFSFAGANALARDAGPPALTRSEERRVGKVWAERVDIGGRRILKKKKQNNILTRK